MALDAAGAPVAFLVDYDGTISLIDIGDELLDRHYPNMDEIARKDALYDAGTLGSRELMQWDMDVLPHDAAFPNFVAAVRGRSAHLEVVSDGLGFYVRSNLAALGLDDVFVATNETVVGRGGEGMSFPFGHPACFVCGTCKRERVRLHQAEGRVVVFIGDGTSDRFAAAHADVVFAKGSLERICRAEGWPYHRWFDFGEVLTHVDEMFHDGRLPAQAADLPAWKANHAPAPRPFICGPEVWGPGRTTPGPGPR